MLHSWKFAANGIWEEALSIDAKQPIDANVVAQWVAHNPQNIALEAIFDESGNPATMFGVRITDLPKTEQVSRIRSMVEKTDIIRTEADFQKVAAAILPEFPLFSHELEALNIGIVNQWYSFAPETLWDRHAKEPITSDQLKQKAPRFFDPTHNPAAIEFWYTQPMDHWYKIYVSDPCADGNIINTAKYQAAINRLTLML